MAYRSVAHASTGYSPHYMQHGREMTLPGEFLIKNDLKGLPVEEHVKQLKHRLQEAFSEAFRNSSKSAERRLQTTNKDRKLRNFREGEMVYLHDPALRPGDAKKWHHPWGGPYQIKKKI
ncbi:uncharacterized protein LOC120350320 [Nilaparvata lugens]|uniref:uncharacterized protein LOC120350320 n=1 Tax=Nilaparvata lugens TaxID=108931 RepID=UPI00193D4CB8|nr:uncharacterized protein LOC120350320 [Nilaparvata lugens]